MKEPGKLSGNLKLKGSKYYPLVIGFEKVNALQLPDKKTTSDLNSSFYYQNELSLVYDLSTSLIEPASLDCTAILC